ncbi:MAG: hypothetical protein JKY95_04365 [Planctomycetaceae bacterium]|nr:hypothetical protein [Planctomycetaceae bacterium]
MFSDSAFEYDLAILGNDPIGLQLAGTALDEFVRVVLIAEESASENQMTGLNRLVGCPRFESEHHVICESPQGRRSVSARYVVIATGSNLLRPRWMIDHPYVVFAQEESLPAECDRVAIVQRNSIDFRNRKENCSRTDRHGMMHLDANIIGLEEEQGLIRIYLDQGESTLVDAVVVNWSEQLGMTSFLNLQAVGLSADDHGCLWCNGNYETWTAGIYAVGDVVGYPSPKDGTEEQIGFILNSMTASRQVLIGASG